MPLATDHEDVVAAAGLDDPDELVAVAQVEGDQPVPPARVIGVERRLLHRALPGGEEQEALAGEVAGVDDRLDRLTRLQRQQVDDRHALRRALALGDVEARRRYTLPKLEKNNRWAWAVVKMTWRTRSSAFSLAPLTPRPPRAWVLNERRRHRLDVLRLGHHDDELLVVDEVLDRHVAGVEGDLAHARRGELLLDRQQLVLDDAAQQHRVGEDRFQLTDRRADVCQLGLEVDARQPGQLAQLHVEDVDRLDLGELERLGHQARLGGGGVVAGPDQGDHLVDDVERLEAALEDVLAVAASLEAELASAG